MIEVLKQALEALETTWYHVGTFAPTDDAIELYDQARTSLRQVIAQLESQEPVALTDDEILDAAFSAYCRGENTRELFKIMRNSRLTCSIGWDRDELKAFARNIEALCTHPPKRTEQEPVAHSVISGALFDFMGWLTSRKERIVLSSADNASPAVEAITEFARMRNLSLDDAKVQDWHTHPPQRTWQGLTDEEIEQLELTSATSTDIREIQAKLKQKNGYAEEKNT